MANVTQTTVPQPGLIQGIGNWIGKNIGTPIYNAAGAIDKGIGNFVTGFAQGAPGTGLTTPTPANAASSAVAANPNTYTVNGKSFNAGGDPSSAPITSAANYTPPAPTLTAGSNNSGGTGNNNPYSLSNYYAAHPDANPANNTSSPTGTGLVPLNNNQTVDAQGNKVPVSTNVATGGGTQTNFPSIVGGLASTAAASSPEYQAAQAAYNQEKQQLANLQTQAAQAQGSVQNTPGLSLQSATGQSGQIQNTLAAEEAPLASEMQASIASAQAATGQQGTQQQGLQGAAGLVAPTAANPYGTYNPLNPTQYTGYGGGSTGSGATAAGVVGGQVNAGTTYAQNSAILGKVNAQIPALVQAINSSGYNASPLTFANQLQQWASGTLSNSAVPEIQGSLNDIVGGLSQVLGVPSSGGSDFRLQFAGSIVNALQKGSSIEDAINFAVQQATAGNQGYLQGAQGANANGTQSTNPTYTPYFGS